MEVEQQGQELSVPNITFLLECEAGTLSFPSSKFTFDEEGFTLDFKKLSLIVTYQNTISIGTSGLALVIYLKDRNNNPDHSDEQPDVELFELVKSAYEKAETTEQFFNMVGPYAITLDFTPYGYNTLQEVYSKLNEFSMLVLEQAEEAEEVYGDMITAQDIDEDGNVIVVQSGKNNGKNIQGDAENGEIDSDDEGEEDEADS